MRCRACNVELDDRESTWKNLETGEYYDLCSGCYGAMREAQKEIDFKIEDKYNEKFKDNQRASEEPTE